MAEGPSKSRSWSDRLPGRGRLQPAAAVVALAALVLAIGAFALGRALGGGDDPGLRPATAQRVDRGDGTAIVVPAPVELGKVGGEGD